MPNLIITDAEGTFTRAISKNDTELMMIALIDLKERRLKAWAEMAHTWYKNTTVGLDLPFSQEEFGIQDLGDLITFLENHQC